MTARNFCREKRWIFRHIFTNLEKWKDIYEKSDLRKSKPILPFKEIAAGSKCEMFLFECSLG